MSYESVGADFSGMSGKLNADIGIGPTNSADDRRVGGGAGTPGIDDEKTIQNWSGSPKSLSKIKTTRDALDYAAAGYKVCIKKGWKSVAYKYWFAFSLAVRNAAGAGGLKSTVIPSLKSADVAAAKLYKDEQPVPEPGKPAAPPIDLSPEAPPVPEQMHSAGFMGLSPMMLVVAAGLAYITFFHKGKKSRKPSRRARRKAKRAYRKR